MPTTTATTTSRSPLLFVYGSLMAPPVMETLIGRVPPSIPARLHGYQRHPVKQHVFPGLIPCQDNVSVVDGIVYRDLCDNERKRLNWFEGSEYVQKVVSVQLPTKEEGGSYGRPALVYEWAHPLSELDTDRSWDYEHFERYKLPWYLKNVVRPCRTELDSFLPLDHDE